MDTLWKDSLNRRYQATIGQLESAVSRCPDEFWEHSVWEVKRTDAYVWPVRTVDGKPGAGKEERERMLQTFSAFWNVAYHAIFHVDFYLSGGDLKGFAPPAPFGEKEHRARTIPNSPYTRDELLGYVAHDREKTHTTIDALTGEQLARQAPRSRGSFADLLLRTLVHTNEHAAQLNLFLSQNGVAAASIFQAQTGLSPAEGRKLLRDGVLGRNDAEIDAFAKSLGGYARLLPPVFTGLCARIESREPATIQFDVGATYIMRIRPDGVTFDKRVPRNVDAIVSVRPQDFLRWMTRSLNRQAALAESRIRVDGNIAAFERVFSSMPSDG